MTSPDVVAGPIPTWVCGSCDAEWWGASKRDVLEDGWKLHDAKRGRMFVMCGHCEDRYRLRREIADGVERAVASAPTPQAH